MSSASRSRVALPRRAPRSRRWTFAPFVCILAATACGGATQRTATEDAPKPMAPGVTQSTGTAASAALTTLTGVYTMDQATRGRTVFLGMCRDCHTPEEQSGDRFAKRWLGQSLGDLYEYLSTEMPKNDPGSLAPGDYSDVMAYMLRINAMPVGTRPLPTDVPALKQIQIAIKTSGRTR